MQARATAIVGALQFSQGDVSVTASVGVARGYGQLMAFEQFYAVSDRALYEAKSAGRCRCVILDVDEANLPAPQTEAEHAEIVQYKTLLEEMEGGVMLADVVDGNIQVTYASPSIYKTTRRDETELGEHGENALSLVYPPDLPRLLGAANKTAATGEVSDLTYRVDKDGAEWRHVRIARLAKRPGGGASLIVALSIMTEYIETAEKLRLSEERYHIATELSRVLIWEVDMEKRTLSQSIDSTITLGHGDGVIRNMPEGLLEAGVIHPCSVEDYRQMYEDLCAGDDSKAYTLLASDHEGSDVWLRASFRMIRDASGKPVRAVGILEKTPNIGTEMQTFEDELRFADDVAPSMLGTIRINLTRDALVHCTLPLPKPVATYHELFALCALVVHPEDLAQFSDMVKPENLLHAFEAGKNWLLVEYRRKGDNGLYRWTNLVLNLLRHPVSREIFVFGYYRDVHIRHEWARRASPSDERDSATLLYTRSAMTAISQVAACDMADDACCSMTVFEILGFDRIKLKLGMQFAQRLIFTIGRICRVMIGGNVVIGYMSEAQFAIFRPDATSVDRQRERILRFKDRARLLSEQIMGDLSLNLACGFALGDRRTYDFDELLRRAILVCAIAREQPGTPVLDYSDPNTAFSDDRRASALPALVRRDVLLVDDDASSRRALHDILSRAYQVHEAQCADEAWTQLMSDRRYALLVCALGAPAERGLSMLARMHDEHRLFDVPFILITDDRASDSEVEALNLGASDVLTRPIIPETLLSRARNIIGRQEAAAMAKSNSLYELRLQQQEILLRQAKYDELTALYNKYGFFCRVRERLDAEPTVKFQLIRWDLDGFKIINDALGPSGGDQLLRDIGQFIRQNSHPDSESARLYADHFVTFLPCDERNDDRLYKLMKHFLDGYHFAFTLTLHMGVYQIDDPTVEVSIMCDRALLAQKTIKGSFTQFIAYYDESIRLHILEEQALTNDMLPALKSGQFLLYYQPQINYDDGTLVGAEALVRWQHPTRGLIPPDQFIPLFERNGFISKLDAYVWEEACKAMRRWLDREDDIRPISVSVNISRVDLYNPELCQNLVALVERYRLPPDFLRLEITESAYMRNPDQLISVVKSLLEAGFTVEMDDFGAGYSSLNTLKDVPVNVLKLDVRFLAKSEDDARGGNILSSVIRMAHWLDLPVIAEGVETKNQADYLKSLNCFYMQGYYFGKPMPFDAFEALLNKRDAHPMDRYGNAQLEGVAAFWDPSAQTTLLFNSFVGGAAILEYRTDSLELLRANDNYYTTLGTTRETFLKRQKNVLALFDPANRLHLVNALSHALATGRECTCELELLPTLGISCRWVHNRMRLLTSNHDCALIYLSIEDVTSRKRLEQAQLIENERDSLIMQATGSGFFDYDEPNDTLSYQVFIPGSGIVERTVAGFFDALSQSPRLQPSSAESLRQLIDEARIAHVNGELTFRADLWNRGIRWCRVRYASIEDYDGVFCRLVGQMDDIQELKEREALGDTVNRFLNAQSPIGVYNSIVADQILNLFYNSLDIGASLDQTLALLGEAFDLSRVYIIEEEDGHASSANTFEWCAAGVEPQKTFLAHVPYSTIGGRDAYLANFDAQGVFYCQNVSEVSEEMRAILAPQGIQAMLQCAIMDNGVFSGFIGFDECRQNRQWTHEQVGTLMFVSRIVGVYLLKWRQDGYLPS